MKKTLLISGAVVLGIAAIIIAVGIYRFNFTNDDIYLSTGEKIDSKGANIEKEAPKTVEKENGPVGITNQNWQWVDTKMNNDEIITPKKSGAFSLNLKEDGAVNGSTDCNGFFGSYTISGNKLTFSQLGSTLMFCEGSQESIFTKSLAEVESYLIDSNNNLLLQLKMDSGVMIFSTLTTVKETATTTSATAPTVNSTPAAVDLKVTTTTLPSTPLIALANPASANCSERGGNLVIQKRGDGGEFGLCYFEDNRACEEWALVRGECPVGGVKTTGFDTMDQKYCAWSGGETFAGANSVCTFKNGKKCPTSEFYNGTCFSVQP